MRDAGLIEVVNLSEEERVDERGLAQTASAHHHQREIEAALNGTAEHLNIIILKNCIETRKLYFCCFEFFEVSIAESERQDHDLMRFLIKMFYNLKNKRFF